MPDEASETLLDKIPQGKPTWILIRSSKQKNGNVMDKVYSQVQSQLRGRVNFRILDWEDEETQDIIDEYSLGEPPASILKDANGKVVEKFEGMKSTNDMYTRLNSLTNASKHKKSAK